MRRILVASAVLAIVLSASPPVGAVNGDLDGNAHSNVGVMIVWDADGDIMEFCGGVLISPRVFLTNYNCPGVVAFAHHPEVFMGLLLFFLGDVEFEFLFVAAGEQSLLFVLLRLHDLGLFGLILLLPRLLLFLAGAHLRWLRAAADVAVLARVLEQRPLQHLAAAIETRHHGSHRAVEDLCDFLV